MELNDCWNTYQNKVINNYSNSRLEFTKLSFETINELYNCKYGGHCNTFNLISDMPSDIKDWLHKRLGPLNSSNYIYTRIGPLTHDDIDYTIWYVGCFIKNCKCSETIEFNMLTVYLDFQKMRVI